MKLENNWTHELSNEVPDLEVHKILETQIFDN